MPDHIWLRSCHLIVPHYLAEMIFKKSATAYVSFNDAQRKILVSPTSNHWFPKIHVSKEYLLKEKDLNGTKSIGIRELIIDHGISENDRELRLEINENKSFIKVNLNQ